MGFIKKQRPAAPWSQHNWWGQYTDPLSMPNTAVSDIQVSSIELQRGDTAWSEADAQLYYCDVPTAGAAVWLPIGGGGGGSTDDHFAPKIIVGNTPNGDPATPQVFPFRYIADPGDGSGIAQALTEAAAAGQGGDIYLRPGVYDFGLAGSPALPLAVPPNVQIRGGGGSAPGAVGGVPSRGATLVLSPTNRALFTMGPICGLSSISVQISTPDPGATGTEVIDATGGGGGVHFIDRCTFFVTADQAASANESLTAIVRGDFVAVTQSIFGSLTGIYQPSLFALPSLVGVEASQLNFSGSQISGIDVGLRFLSDTGTAINANLSNVVTGIDILAPNGPIRISDTQMQVTETGVRVADGNVQMTNMQIFGSSPAAGTVGVEQLSGSLQITSLLSFNFDQCIRCTGGQAQLAQLNIFGGVGTPGVAGITLSSFRPTVVDARIDGFDVGIELATGCTRAKLEGVDLSAGSVGIAQRGGVTEVQIDNCRVDGFGGGSVGLLTEPGGSDTTVRGLYVRGFATGVDYASDYFMLLGANLRTIGTPITATGAPVSPEIAHIQV